MIIIIRRDYYYFFFVLLPSKFYFFRLAQLALDINNSPAWEIPEEEQRPSTKMPLFVKAQSVYSSKHQTEVSRRYVFLT